MGKTPKASNKRKRKSKAEDKVWCPFCPGNKLNLQSLKKHIAVHHKDKFKGFEDKSKRWWSE